MHHSLKDKLKSSVRSSNKDVFLRADFEHLGGNYRQVTRVLGELQKENVLQRAGYGLYTRPSLGDDVPTVIQKVRERLPGRRIHRHVTVGGSTVLLGRSPAEGKAQVELDDFKLRAAKFLVKTFPLSLIRSKSLENLDRWESQGAWVSAHEEWRQLLKRGSDKRLLAVMTGTDQYANRLRQSAPYAGLLSDRTLKGLR